MDSIEQLLKELTETHGGPGYESPIRAVVRKLLDLLFYPTFYGREAKWQTS